MTSESTAAKVRLVQAVRNSDEQLGVGDYLYESDSTVKGIVDSASLALAKHLETELYAAAKNFVESYEENDLPDEEEPI